MNNKHQKVVAFLLCLFISSICYSEVIKLKNGSLVSGSIVKENAHTLNIKTQYGIISLNRKEVVEIMPDMYRVTLRNGGEVVGSIEDINEVFVKINTESGIKNIDLEKVISMDVYDYNSAPNPELVQGAGPVEPQITSAPPEYLVDESGISFDEDLDKAFNKQSAVPQVSIVQYNSGVSSQGVPVATQNAGTVSATSLKQKSKEKKKKEKPKTKAEKIKTDKYKLKSFIVEGVVISTSLKLDASTIAGGSTYEIGDLGYGAGVKYLKRGNKRFWYGGGLLLSSFKSKSFTLDGGNGTLKTNSSIRNLEFVTNYYVNPESKYKTYLSGGLGYISTEVNYRHTDNNGTVISYREKSSGMSLSLGIGIERNFKENALGFELRALNSKRGGKLSSSSGTDILGALRINWKF